MLTLLVLSHSLLAPSLTFFLEQHTSLPPMVFVSAGAHGKRVHYVDVPNISSGLSHDPRRPSPHTSTDLNSDLNITLLAYTVQWIQMWSHRKSGPRAVGTCARLMTWCTSLQHWSTVDSLLVWIILGFSSGCIFTLQPPMTSTWRWTVNCTAYNTIHVSSTVYHFIVHLMIYPDLYSGSAPSSDGDAVHPGLPHPSALPPHSQVSLSNNGNKVPHAKRVCSRRSKSPRLALAMAVMVFVVAYLHITCLRLPFAVTIPTSLEVGVLVVQAASFTTVAILALKDISVLATSTARLACRLWPSSPLADRACLHDSHHCWRRVAAVAAFSAAVDCHGCGLSIALCSFGLGWLLW